MNRFAIGMALTAGLIFSSGCVRILKPAGTAEHAAPGNPSAEAVLEAALPAPFQAGDEPPILDTDDGKIPMTLPDDSPAKMPAPAIVQYNGTSN